MATEIGSAYFTLMPSMKGVSAAVNKGLSGIDTGSAGNAMGDKAGKGFGKGLLGAGAIAGAAAAVTSKAMGVISDSMGDAVKRVDTMNNFPKIMQNLGISSDDASAAVTKISDSLTGLPTTLDSATNGVTRLVSKNNDINRSTDMFLAMNNAILAGGASSDIQSAAVEQLTQAYSKGKMDMQEWRSLQTAMPAQLAQVAKAFGISTDALGEGLRDGSISMDDFMGKIMDLNETGVDGLSSFDEQARSATGGIGTSLTNVKTAVTRSLADIIQSIGAANISSMINTFGKVISAVGKVVGSIIGFIIESLSNLNPVTSEMTGIFQSALPIFKNIGDILKGVLKSAIDALMPAMKSMATAIGELVAALVPLIAQIASALMPVIEQIVPVVVNVIDAILPIITAALNVITSVITTITALLSGDWDAAWNGALSIFSNVWALIQSIVSAAVNVVKSVISGALNVIRSIWQQIWSGISSFASSVWNSIKSVISSAVNAVRSVILSVVSSISSVWSNAWNSMKNLIGNVWNGITSGVSSGIGRVLSLIGNLPGQIIGFFGNAGSWLIDAGRNIISGLLDGLKGAFDGVKNFVGGIGGWIADNKGPKAYDLALLVPAGTWIMEGLENGIAQQLPSLKKKLGTVSEVFEEWKPDNTFSRSLSAEAIADISYSASSGISNERSSSDAEVISLLNYLVSNLGHIIQENAPSKVEIVKNKEFARAVNEVMA